MYDRPWTAHDMPDRQGRTAVVTGANSGLGQEAALLLAQRGAAVVLACRSTARADQAADRTTGVLGEVRAAVDPTVRGGEFYGPSGRLQLTGHPVRVRSSSRSYDLATQQRLWQESERLTGVTYAVPSAPGLNARRMP